MFNRLTMTGLAGLVLVTLASSAVAAESSALLGDASWQTFSKGTNASLGWADVDESLSMMVAFAAESVQAVVLDERAEDLDLLRAVAAPEPPVLVLAGLAFGGVLCGRSVLGWRRQNAPRQDDQV